MEPYKLEVKKSVFKDFKNIDKKDLPKVLEKIKNLAMDPRPVGCIKLTNKEAYRVRQGSYRILYTIQEEIITVTVVKVGHRKSVYK